jgi:hypothetical protein
MSMGLAPQGSRCSTCATSRRQGPTDRAPEPFVQHRHRIEEQAAQPHARQKMTDRYRASLKGALYILRRILECDVIVERGRSAAGMLATDAAAKYLRCLAACGGDLPFFRISVQRHRCIEATSCAVADFGYSMTVARDACATINLEFDGTARHGTALPAAQAHVASMAALGFGYASVTATHMLGPRRSGITESRNDRG